MVNLSNVEKIVFKIHETAPLKSALMIMHKLHMD